MFQYVVKRLLILIPVFFGITIIIFTLIHIMPGDPYSTMMDPGLSAADREQMLEAIGYYDPLPVQYVRWLSRAFAGDLGYSTHYLQPVTTVIGEKLGNTLLLSVSVLILSVLLAVPLGVISAVRQYSALDYFATILAFIGISIPSFFLALGVLKIFAFDLGWFPISGLRTIGANYTGLRALPDLAHHAVLPILVLTVIQMASLMRYTRSSMLEAIQMDYTRTARAKGLSEHTVIYKHALRNSMISVTTLITISLGNLLSGAVLTETVFGWPGMGTLMYQAIGNRDYSLVTACALLLTVFILLSNLLADILYAVVDPRIRYQ